MCHTILGNLEPCDILGRQTTKQRVAIIQIITDQGGKTGFVHKIYIIGETTFCARAHGTGNCGLNSKLGWVINQKKFNLNLTQVFLFIDYKFHLDTTIVRPIQDNW